MKNKAVSPSVLLTNAEHLKRTVAIDLEDGKALLRLAEFQRYIIMFNAIIKANKR